MTERYHAILIDECGDGLNQTYEAINSSEAWQCDQDDCTECRVSGVEYRIPYIYHNEEEEEEDYE